VAFEAVLQRPLDLSGITPAALTKLVPEATLEEARRILSRVHRGISIEQSFSGVRRTALEAVRARGRVARLTIEREQRSALDPFVKYLLVAEDAARIETVRIPLENKTRFSACVSSQVGCALGCTFCKTGTMGLVRNLDAWEIVDQVRVVKEGIAKDGIVHDGVRSRGSGREQPAVAGRVHGVVFQGMGEPLANLDEVLAAIAVMCEPSALAIDARAITVCTSGLPSGIVRLAKEAPRVRLGWSISSARPDVRRRLMPITEKHPIDAVLAAVCEHARTTELAPMWAVTLLSGVNDTEDDAHALADLAERFTRETSMRARITIVPYNDIGATDGEPFARSADSREVAFFDALKARGIFAHKRYSGGSDVGAACGQLATATAT
jgi:23S rRNA (adenine2503-C2)-methyltransferase